MTAMVTTKVLASFRSQVPECNLALWSDIRSGTVLSVDAALDYPQEYLDAFSNMATQALSLPRRTDQDGTCVIAANASGLQLFATGIAMPGVALTCLASLDADIANIQSAALSLVSSIAFEGVT